MEFPFCILKYIYFYNKGSIENFCEFIGISNIKKS
jgi:hypothetical protein